MRGAGSTHLGLVRVSKSHFFLTFLLLDLLKHSAPSRVINVSSSAHIMGKIQFDDLSGEKNYHPVKAYTQSKLANVLFTRELAKRTEVLGVMAYSVDPGLVNTEITRHIKRPLVDLFKTFSFLLKTSAEGAYSIIYCIVTPENQLLTGGYYKDCAKAESSRPAQDDGTALKLWAVCFASLAAAQLITSPAAGGSRTSVCFPACNLRINYASTLS
ncbi:hypothetical protein PAMP_011307 [Pampus punctatissimus]